MKKQIVFFRHKIVAKQETSLSATVFLVSAVTNPEKEWKESRKVIEERLKILSREMGCELILEPRAKADVLFHLSRQVVEDQSQCNGIGVYPSPDYDMMYAHIGEKIIGFVYS